MRRPTEKDPKILIALGARLAAAKRTLPPDGYDAFKRREPESFGTRTTRGDWSPTKDQRLIRIYCISALRDNVSKLPDGLEHAARITQARRINASLPDRTRRDQSLEHA
jgi:hypothetical protein